MLLVRVDGNASSGYGHVIRGVAVAEAAIDRGIEVVVATVARDPVVAGILERNGLHLEPLTATDDRSWASALGNGDAAVFDGYHLGTDDHAAASARGAAVGVVDDLGMGTFDVDVLLNQNPGSGTSYRTAERTVSLLGCRHALVRRAFRQPIASEPGDSSRLLVTFGAADASGMTMRVAEIARARWTGEVVALLGPGSPDVEPPTGVVVVRDPPSVAALMRDIAAAVSAAGSTTWELLVSGVPAVLVPVAENQEVVIAELDPAGAALVVRPGEDFDRSLADALDALADPDVRARLRDRGHRLVDGRGVERLLDRLPGLNCPDSLLRPATMADADDLRHWRNDPTTRAASFDQVEVSAPDHHTWLRGCLADPDRELAIVVIDGTGAGSLRYDRVAGDRWEVSISLDRGQRGRGLGRRVLEEGARWLARRHHADVIEASVKESNDGSLRAFVAAGFIELERVDGVARLERRAGAEDAAR